MKCSLHPDREPPPPAAPAPASPARVEGIELPDPLSLSSSHAVTIDALSPPAQPSHAVLTDGATQGTPVSSHPSPALHPVSHRLTSRPCPSAQLSYSSEHAAPSSPMAREIPCAAIVAALPPGEGVGNATVPSRTPYRLPSLRQDLRQGALRSPSVFAAIREHARYSLRPSPRRVQRLHTLVADENIAPVPTIAALFAGTAHLSSRINPRTSLAGLEMSPFAPPEWNTDDKHSDVSS